MQMAVPHTGWIDTMPFPRMRDNLIRRHDQFDHWRFLGDLGGYLVDRGLITGPHTPTLTSQIRSASGEYKIDGPKEDDGDDPLSEWNGAIVWGQPYEKENWEFTVHFLEKWAWVFEGCEEIVSVTNTWRQGRGAPLLQPRIQGTTSSYAEPLPRAVQKMGA